MSALEGLLAALERETHAVRDLARQGALEKCETALARRGAVLASIAEQLARPDADPLRASRAAARALEIDAELVAELCGERESVRTALEEVRHARRAARSMNRSDGTGRFVRERI